MSFDSDYELISKDDDTYMVKIENGSVQQFNRKNMLECLRYLHDCVNKKITELNHQERDYYNRVMETIRLLSHTQASKDLIFKDIHDIFLDCKNSKVDTVGSHFWYCFNDQQFKGPLGCNPKCAMALKGFNECHDTRPFGCQDQVLSFDDDAFTPVNENRTEHAYIYVKSPHFRFFNKQHVKQLKHAGIKEVTIAFGNGYGSYKNIKEHVKVDKLHLLHGENVNNNVWWTVISIFIILLFFIIVCYIEWRRHY